jgi:hypothetical protein
VKTVTLGYLDCWLFQFSHLGTVPRAQSRNDEESIKNAYRAYVQAWKTKDLAALQDLISPDYRAVNF